MENTPSPTNTANVKEMAKMDTLRENTSLAPMGRRSAQDEEHVCRPRTRLALIVNAVPEPLDSREKFSVVGNHS